MRLKQILRSAQAGRIVHALLFSGPRGTGKRSIAYRLARTLLCHAPPHMRPCNSCSACKSVYAGTHPDLHRLAPEGKSIPIDALREFQKEINLTSYEGGMKLAIIEDADKIKYDSQNTLLLTLENPPKDTLILLLTERPEALLPTILSRCVQIRFKCMEIDECAKALRSAYGASGSTEAQQGTQDRSKDYRRAATLAQGSFGLAKEIYEKPGFYTLYEDVICALEELRNPSEVLGRAVKLEKKGSEGNVLYLMEFWAHDLLRVQYGQSPLDQDNVQRLRRSKLDANRLLRRIILARRQFELNIPWQHVLETMLFELLSGEY